MNPQEKLELLSKRFAHLEIHAASGGREIKNILLEILDEYQAQPLAKIRVIMQGCVRQLLPFIPPYAPVLNAINQLLVMLDEEISEGEDVKRVKERLTKQWHLDTGPSEIANLITQKLLPQIKDSAIVYTHTLSETVINVLTLLNDLGKIRCVYVTESRPNNDGIVTAGRLADLRMDVYVTIDAAMPIVIPKADLMISGAELINRNGTVIGKVGAYPAAVFCRMEGKPVFILADHSKLSPLPIDVLPFTNLRRTDLGITSTSKSLKVVGSFFDVTPADFIHRYLTDRGVYKAGDLARELSDHSINEWFRGELVNAMNVTRSNNNERTLL